MNNKDAYYFSHDANARREDKCIALIAEYGYEGYGRFWALIEILREQPGYQIDIGSKFGYAKLADELKMTRAEIEQFVKSCIEDFELLKSDGKNLWSDSLFRRMQTLDENRKRLSDSGRRGGIRSQEKRKNEALLENSEAPLEENPSPAPQNSSNKNRIEENKEEQNRAKQKIADALERMPLAVIEDIPTPDRSTQAETEFRHNDFLTKVVAHWRGCFSFNPPQNDIQMLKRDWDRFGTTRMLWAITHWSAGGYRDKSLIHKALAGEFDFNYKDKPKMLKLSEIQTPMHLLPPNINANTS